MPNTREKLIELSDIEVMQREKECVKRKSATNCTDCLNCDLLMTDERILSAYDNAIHALQNANGVTVQQWISVKDRLPEDDLPKDTDRKQIRCLVSTDKGTVKPCVRQRYQTKKNGQWCLSPWEWNKDLFAKPTHWLHLPHPPKGE